MGRWSVVRTADFSRCPLGYPDPGSLSPQNAAVKVSGLVLMLTMRHVSERWFCAHFPFVGFLATELMKSYYLDSCVLSKVIIGCLNKIVIEFEADGLNLRS